MLNLSKYSGKFMCLFQEGYNIFDLEQIMMYVWEVDQGSVEDLDIKIRFLKIVQFIVSGSINK